MKNPPRTIHVGVLAYPGCLRSSAVVPLDVLRIANALTGYRPAAQRIRFECGWLGARGEPSLAVDGLVFPLAPLEGAKIDALIVPAVAHDAPHELSQVLDGLAPEQAAIAAYAAGGGLLVSSCSSTGLVARTGLLDGRRATTSWWLSSWFRHKFPDVLLDADALVVQDGALVSSGGFGSTLDLALWLVGHFGGEELRQLTARILVMDAHRASQAPYVSDAIAAQGAHPTIERARRWLNARLDQPWTMAQLAAHCALSQRTLLRRFQEALGVSPVQYAQQLRVERAKALLETTGLSLEEITVRCGYEDAATFSKVFKRWAALTPREYRQRFALVR
ncbi:GlxA family transcriptional regulator [Massilia sp.]|uniref:GlxA family transcriptional regulator n=1 Tax=Massilia sp. TaxID=1882437 RepID=UPI0028B0D0B3|nr:helix-turn-helix domain-containing protein [Massilia sp.]